MTDKQDEQKKLVEEHGVIRAEITDEMKKAYLDYAMSVIVARALPAVEDGLKPVHRRILYAMHTLGLKPEKPTVKSAKIVGEVIANYHPHGDISVYDAMVRMAQNFSLRYPLVHGQGNFGSIDADPAAAYRYCVSGDSLIVTEQGMIPISNLSEKEDINVGILSKDKKVHRAVKWFDSGDYPTKRIVTDKGYSLAGSFNHPVLTLACDATGKPIFVWKLLEHVKEGDVVVLDRAEDDFWPQEEINLESFYPALASRRTKVRILPKTLNEDLAFILGSLVSEGFIGENKIEFCNTDEHWIRIFEDKWKNLFPDSTLHKFLRKPSSYGKKEYQRLECHCLYTIEFLKNIGLLPVKSHDKEIPKTLLRSPKRVLAAFIRAYFEGDGSLSYTQHMMEIRACSVSPELLRILQTILLRFGIDSFRRFDKHKNLHLLQIRDKRNFLRFYKEIGFLSDRKTKKLELINLLYKKECSQSDFIPFISDFVRNLSQNTFIMRNNFDRYENLSKNYGQISQILQKEAGMDYQSLFEYLLTYRYLFDKVNLIQDAGIQNVYSVKVDSECHSFVANGFINHNTEAKIAKVAMEILEDLEKETVNFVPTFDNIGKEPETLPARLPNLLLNGASGIAVGMATNIPPHNLNEVAEAIIACIDKPMITIEELMQIVKGPDFPTGGYVAGEIKEMYLTGKGSLTLRGKTTTEEFKGKDRENIIITEIPYNVNKSELIKEIALMTQDKKIQDISDIRDESAKGRIRIVIELKKGANADFIVNQLYKYTRLQDRFGANMLALVGGKPKVLNLKQFLEEYINYRKIVLRRRTEFELRKAKERQEIVEGLLIALKSIDEVITLIKKSKNAAEASEALQSKFKLSKRQAQAILETKLQQLTSLEREKLQDESKELKETISGLETILGSEKEILNLIKKDLRHVMKEYGDERRTHVMRKISELSEKELIEEKEVVVTITEKGYCKRMDVQTYKEQKRGGKGVIGSGLASDDFVRQLITCSTHDVLLFFTNRGRLYWLKTHEIPVAERQSKGKAIANLLNLKDETITNVIAVKKFENYLIMATKLGMVKKIALSAFSNPRSTGIRAINLPPDNSDTLIGVEVLKTGQEIVLSTRKGQAIRFDESEIRPMGRASYGVTGIKMDKGDEVVALEVFHAGDKKATVLSVTEKGYGKRSAVEDYRKTGRAGKGVINLKVSDKTGKVVTTVSVKNEDDVIVTTAKGMIIRVPVDQLRVIGRATQGVRIVRMKDPADKVMDAVKVVEEEDKAIESVKIEKQEEL